MTLRSSPLRALSIVGFVPALVASSLSATGCSGCGDDTTDGTGGAGGATSSSSVASTTVASSSTSSSSTTSSSSSSSSGSSSSSTSVSTSTSTSASGTGGAGGAGGAATVCTPGATQACYTGPAGTEGVGACKAGVRTCDAQGAGFGECTGDVLPATEACNLPGDEDCDGQAPTCTGAHVWSKRFGDADYQVPADVATDASGNVFVSGQFRSAIDFGGGPLAASGVVDAFVTKLDASGAHVWSKRFGDADNQFGGAIAADAVGNVFVTGSFAGGIDLGGGLFTSGGVTDVFVAKLDAAGNHLWSKAFGGANYQDAYGAATDAAGNLIVAGTFADSVDFGGGALTSAGSRDLFVVKLDASGNHVWSKRFGGTGNDALGGVTVDGTGNVVLGGVFTGTVDFGGGPLTTSDSADAFVAKLDASGNHVWSKRFDGDDYEGVNEIATDASGNVLAIGDLIGTIDFGGGPLSAPMNDDVFVLKLDPAGNHVWSKSFGTEPGVELGYAIAVDASGNVVITGELDGEADFGGGPLTSDGTDTFLVKLDPSGAHLWSAKYGADNSQYGESVAIDPSGNVILGGRMSGAADFGGGPLTSAGSADVYVAKFAP